MGTATVNNYTTDHWTKKGAEVNNYYCRSNDTLPVRFFELKGGLPKSWDFDLKTYVAGAVDPALFKAPCTNLCGGDCRFFRKEPQAE